MSEQEAIEAPAEAVDPFSYLEGDSETVDPFAEANDTRPTDQPVTDGEVVGEDSVDDPAMQRVRDWQSKHDSLLSEFEQFKQKAEDSNVLMRYVQENPGLAQQVFAQIEQSLSGNGSSSAVGEPQEAESSLPQEPTPPEQPADYSEQDAWMEPSSSSFKYRQKVEEYRMEQLRYENALLRHEMKQTVAPIQQTFEQQQQMLAERQRINGIMNAFTETGLPVEEAQSVMQWASAYQVTPQDIVALHRMKTGQAPPSPQGEQAAEVLRSRNKRLSFPLPSSTGAGNTASSATKAPEDSIFDELLQMDRANDPWS